MTEHNYLDRVTLALVIAGAIDLGLRGIGTISEQQISPLEIISRSFEPAAIALYIIVGLAGLYQVYFGYRFYAD